MCLGKKDIKKVSTGHDYDPNNWENIVCLVITGKQELTIKAVGRKNVVAVKVGNVETEMFADSGAEVSIVPSHWYKKEMGKLQPSTETLRGYGASKPLDVKAKFLARITTIFTPNVTSDLYLMPAMPF